MIYTELLKAAQLASTREEAQKILDYVTKLGLIENTYQQYPFAYATK